MLQGAGPVGSYPKLLKSVVSAGCFAYRAFCSWVLVPGVLVPGVRVLGVALTRSAKRVLRVLEALGALGSLGVVCELWLGVVRVFHGRVCVRR
jgi:hypothetical protein